MTALAAGPDGIDGEYCADRVLVKFKQTPTRAALRTFASNNNLNLRRVIRRVAIHDFKIPDGRRVADVIEALSANPRIEFAEPDYIRYATYIPNDPLYGSQWDMTLIGMETAWNSIIGDPSVVVAVLDTGIYLTHPDLVNNLWQNPGEIAGTGVDNDGNGYIDDVNGYDFAGDGQFPGPGAEDPIPNDDYVGHGTHVSGTIGAEQDNLIGMSGEASGVKLMAVRVLGGIAGMGYSSDISEGIIYAADNGAHVINMSLGGTGTGLSEYLALKYAWDNNVFVAAAAGNDGASGNPILYPAGYTFTMSIGATDRLDNIASFSTHNIFVEVSAPGVNILSTVPPAGYQSSGWSGTSMATPHAAGLAALLYSAYGDMTNWQARSMLQNTAVGLGAPGWDQYFGHGRIDAAALVTAPRPTGDDLEILTPPDGGTFPSGSILSLLWNPVNGAASYRIRATLPSSAIATLTTTAPYYTRSPSLPTPLGAYSVTIDALDGGGATISSDTVSFVRQ
jgi:subtilisin family serine protease